MASEDEFDVLHLIASNDRRGAEVFAAGLHEALRAHNIGGEVVALSASSAPNALGFDVIPLHPKTLPLLRRRAARAAVVVGHGSRGLPGGTLATLGPRRPPFVYRSIGDPNRWSMTSRLRRARVAAQLGRCAAVVGLWPGAAQVIQSGLGVAKDRVAVIPNAADTVVHQPASPTDRAEARASFGLTDGPVAVIIGAHSREKRVPLAVEAATRVKGLQVLVAGDGPEHGQVLSVAAGHDGIRILGALNDVTPLYHAGDVILSTSETEGQPGAVLEAALSGLAVVATDVGGTSSVAGNRAVLVDAEADAGTIAAALGEALTLPPSPPSALRAVHSMERVSASWAELLRGVVQQR